MKKLTLIFAIAISLGRHSFATDILPGQNFVDGQRLTAAQLGLLVSQATIQNAFYTAKVAQGAPVVGDVFLVYSPSSATFHKLTGQDLLYGNTNIISTQVNYSSIAPYSRLLFFDPTNAWLGQVAVSLLASNLSSSVTASNLVFWTTNGAQLPLYPLAINPANTNNQLKFVVFDTNGAPSYITLSNGLVSVTPWLYTNNSGILPYVYKQVFAPQTLYGTNGATNVWAQTTVFPVTNVYMFANTNVTALSTNDSFPILSTLQGSNTTATITALIGLLNALNVLPNYTTARIQFNGNSTSYFMPALADTADGNSWLFSTNNPFATNTVTAFSFVLGAGLPTTTPQVLTNQVYYGIRATGANTNAFKFFHTYTNATGYLANSSAGVGTNWIRISGNSSTNAICYVSPFTTFQADVTASQISGKAVQDGVYDIWFRQQSTTTNYYVSGTVQPTAASANALMMLSFYSRIATNSVRIDTLQSGATAALPRVEVLISAE